MGKCKLDNGLKLFSSSPMKTGFLTPDEFQAYLSINKKSYRSLNTTDGVE